MMSLLLMLKMTEDVYQCFIRTHNLAVSTFASCYVINVMFISYFTLFWLQFIIRPPCPHRFWVSQFLPRDARSASAVLLS